VKPAVLVTRRVPVSALSRLKSACDVDLYVEQGGLSPEALRKRISGKCGLVCMVTDTIDRSVIDAGTDLRVIANVAVGYDNVDVAYAQSRGIFVTNTPDVLTQAVAEFTWGLILAVSRRIAEGDRLVRAGRWRGWALDFMLGMSLYGKRLGIVGLGRIGRAVAGYAQAFGMDVVATSRKETAKVMEQTDSEFSGIRRVSLDELLVTSDVVSLHIPMNDTTRHLINRRALTRMKRTAFLINTSRGPIVDETALVWALQERLIAGVGLDVYEDEPSVHPGLYSLEAAVLAPHLGSATGETRMAMADLAAENVVSIVNGNPPITPVKLELPGSSI